jgi:HlyD family secretion protein
LFILLAVLVLVSCSRYNTRRVSGTVEADEVHVASRYGGRVVGLHAQEGDTLRAGQLIVELDATELRARYEHAEARLAELEHGPRPADIAAAKSEWEALVAQVDLAVADEKRANELFEQKVNSAHDRDQATSRSRQITQSADAAKKRYDLLVEGTRPEQIAQARAQLAEIDTQLREMRVVAPTNVVLEVLNVKVGDVLPANREVATLLMPVLWVRVYVPEPWLGRIQVGQTVTVGTDSSREMFTGIVEQISRQAEFTPRNVQTVADRIRQVFGVKVRLPSDTSKLRAGMSVDVAFSDVPPFPK